MRLPKSRPTAPKSPGTPLNFASPGSMTPTPQWQEKIRLQSRLKNGEWKHSLPIFDDSDDTVNTSSFYGRKSEIEFVSDLCVAKSMYEKVKGEAKSELEEVTRKLGARRRSQKFGSSRSLMSIDSESKEEESRLSRRFPRSGSQGSLKSIDGKSNTEEDAVYLTPKRRSRRLGRSGSQGSLKSIDCKSDGEGSLYLTPKKQAEKERKKRIEERRKRLGKSPKRRSFYEMEADANSYHGSVTSIEYLSDEDDLAEHVYDQAKRAAEEEILKTPYSPGCTKPKMVKQLSGYNFSEYLLSND